MHNSQRTFRDDDYLRRRVRLYIQVMLIIDLFAWVSDFVGTRIFDALPPQSMPPTAQIMRNCVTVFMLGAWAYTRFLKPPRIALISLEIGTTLGLSFIYGSIAVSSFTGDFLPYGPTFGLLGTMLLLVVRASLVPSHVGLTIGVGVAAVGAFSLAAREALVQLPPRALDGLFFGGAAFVITNAATSHVIYGLRRQVSKAKQLGQYRLGTKLGEGGMGAVYRASHAMLRREAAIKLIKPEHTQASGARYDRALQRFEREAQVTAHLTSPHTVQLYDFGIADDGSFYYVMELLDGVDLDTAVSRYGPMPPARVAFLLEQACDSLDEAHAVGMVHRDIKPANLFLCRQGVRFDFVKVLDFGLVSLDPERDRKAEKLTDDGFVGGTPAFIPPEMVSGDVEVDGRADIYALGCVAYWMLTGRAPFEGRGVMGTVLAHVNEVPPPPSSGCELPIPAALESLVMRCLEKKPCDRPATARELASLLAEAVPDAQWDQERARSWWDIHQPGSPHDGLPPTVDAGLRVTKMFDA